MENIIAVMSRMIIERDESSMCLKFDGREVDIRREGGRQVVYPKGSSIQLSCTKEEVDLQNRSLEGTVVAVGTMANERIFGVEYIDGVQKIKGEIKPGDKVRYSKYASHPETINGKSYDIINDDDIIFIQKGDK